MRKWIVALTLCGALTPAVRADTDTIMVGNFFFSPALDTVFRGDTVVWVFASGLVSHTTSHDVALADRIWDSGIVPPGSSFSFVFDTSGTFPYRCDVHPLTMLATLVVLEPLAPNVTHQVRVGSFFFDPDTLNIAQGDTVNWTIDDPVVPHTVTHDVPAALRLFDSGVLTDSQSFSYVFDTSGVFPVFCTLHPLLMTQMIFVTGGPACADTDQDGVCDADDNCVDDFNNRQEDEDLDGLGDVCDPCLGDSANACIACTSGDVNADGMFNAADVIYLVNYAFKSGPAPLPVPESGDVVCDGSITASDVIYLVNFVFKSGPAPCASC